MKGLFGVQKTLAILVGAGVTVVIAGAAVLANGGSATVQPCDPTVQTDCVTVFAPVIHNRELATGPSFTDISGGTLHPVITMTGVPNGFYKVEANGVLDIPLSDAVATTEPLATALDWTCQLVLVTADNGTGSVVDLWESEAVSLTDTTFFLKAAVNINSSNGVGTFRVDCSQNDTGDAIWSSSSLKIIAVSASDLITYSN